MKNHYTTNEILLVTGTTFSGRDFCRITETRPMTEKQRLEKACWDGLLVEMLPEVVQDSTTMHRQYTWHVKLTDQLLVIKMGTTDEDIPVCSSINPYYYLLSTSLN